MDLQTLQQAAGFLPVLKLLGREARDVSEDEIKQVASTFAGENSTAFADLLSSLKDAEPTERVSKLLSSPTAQKVLIDMTTRVKASTDAANSTLFAKCPSCGVCFETDLKS